MARWRQQLRGAAGDERRRYEHAARPLGRASDTRRRGLALDDALAGVDHGDANPVWARLVFS